MPMISKTFFKSEVVPDQKQINDCWKYANCNARVCDWANARIGSMDPTRRWWPSATELEEQLRQEMNCNSELFWLHEVPGVVIREALRNVLRAIESYVHRSRLKSIGYIPEKVSSPGSGSRNGKPSHFGIGDEVEIGVQNIHVPGLGWLPLKRKVYLPPSGVRILSAQIRQKAGRWFITLEVEIDMPVRHQPAGDGIIGVDLGILNLATLSDGSTVKNPRAAERHAWKTRELQASIRRKKKGSVSWKKAKKKLARHQVHVANIRRDSLHKLTSHLTNSYACVAIENLDVPGMIKRSPQFSSAIQDVGFGQFRRQMLYKDEVAGSFTVVGPRYFPSTQRCSGCGIINRTLTLEVRRWRCECGLEHDRDHNAARNQEGLIAGSATEMPITEIVAMFDGITTTSEQEVGLDFLPEGL